MFTSNLPNTKRGADFTFSVVEAGPEGVTRFTARNRKAGLRISVVDGVAADSCTVGNWSAPDFRAKLEAEGFDLMEVPR